MMVIEMWGGGGNSKTDLTGDPLFIFILQHKICTNNNNDNNM